MPFGRLAIALALIIAVSALGFACAVGESAPPTPQSHEEPDQESPTKPAGSYRVDAYDGDSTSYTVMGAPEPTPLPDTAYDEDYSDEAMPEPTGVPEPSSSSNTNKGNTYQSFEVDSDDGSLSDAMDGFEPAPTVVPGATTFQDYRRSPLVSTTKDRTSTFSLDTDRTSFHLALNWAREGFQIDPDSVRAEEWVNAFHYGYQKPSRQDSFAISSTMVQHPLQPVMHLARITFQAPDVRDRDRPLNVTLVMDASGSMADGNRVEIARAAAEAIRDSLGPKDRISIVQFSTNVLHQYTVEAREPGHRSVTDSIRALRPNDSTNVQAGLDLGVSIADRMRYDRPDAYNYVILMSDGVANVDATDPFAILETSGDRQDHNPLRLITIGVGISNYNDYLLEQLAQHGNGWYRYLDDEAQARQTFRRDNWTAISTPFADQTRAQVHWDPNVVASWRLVGYENRIAPDQAFVENRREFAEIPSGAATTVFYELQLNPHAAVEFTRPIGLGDVSVRWVTPITGRTLQQDAVISGNPSILFDSSVEDMLRFGAVVALASDRYSGLPYVESEGASIVGQDLRTLEMWLERLEPGLSHLDSYHDFAYVLRHMVNSLPEYGYDTGNSGYSP